MKKFLVIQTAFIGDVVLSTALLASLHEKYPDAQIDLLVRKGNESLLKGHPYIHEVLIWDKKENKYLNGFRILKKIRSTKYDAVINVQRFAATGLFTAFSKATLRIGFDKNPFSFLFTHVIKHIQLAKGVHEIDKNHDLLSPLGEFPKCKPSLYVTPSDLEAVKKYQGAPYICMAPASVWFTKQFPVNQWVKFINNIPFNGPIYLIGGPGDANLLNAIIEELQLTQNYQHYQGQLHYNDQAQLNDQVQLNDPHEKKLNVISLAGKLSFLESAALQKQAVMNYVNDSAPMHFASAVNAPVTAIYCSTIPDFGFGPLSDQSFIVETKEQLACKPCGLHGKKACPLGHFNCAQTIQLEQLILPISKMA